jgi:hypothetical protein
MIMMIKVSLLLAGEEISRVGRVDERSTRWGGRGVDHDHDQDEARRA